MFTRNFDVVKSHVMLNESHAYVDSSGRPYFATNSSENWMPTNIFYLMRNMTTSYDSRGVILGTGDTPVQAKDYKLSGSIISGYTMSYIQSRGIHETYGAYARTKYTITNNNTSAFTIKEIGLINSSPACLIERQILEVPITIEGYGGVGQIEYTIYYNPTDVTYDADIDIEGVYGVEWDYSSTSPLLKRFGSATNFEDPQPATSSTEVGTSPFDNVLPWSGMKRYNVNSNTLGAAEGDSGFDMTASDVVVHIPEFYYCVQDDPYNMRRRWAISASPRDGFEKHPGSGRYVGRYHTSTVGGEYCTRSSVNPTHNVAVGTQRTSSHNKGSDWWMMDIATWSAIQLLYLVEFATFNTTSVLGTGFANDADLSVTGTTDSCVYHTLRANSGGNQYRWIENPYSNIGTRLDGWEHWNNNYYETVRICLDNVKTGNGYNGEGYIYTGVTNSYSGYMSRLYYIASMPWLFIPYSANGSSSTYMTEYSGVGYTNGSYGCQCVIGRPHDSNNKTGFFYRYLNGGSSTTRVGSRLIYIP